MAQQGKRIDLSQHQSGAWAVVRTHTLHGFQRELLKAARDRGVDMTAMAQGQSAGAIELADVLEPITFKYQVLEWHIADDDGNVLGSPREVQASDLAFCDGALLQALMQAINDAKNPGDAAEVIPNPTPPSAAS